MAYGNVYVFNMYSQTPLDFKLNGQGLAGKIGEMAGPAFTPKQIVVGRTNLNKGNLTSPLFVSGENDIQVSTMGQRVFGGTVTIPASSVIPLNESLWIYIAYEKLFLFNTNGMILDTAT